MSDSQVINALRAGDLTLAEYLAQVKARFKEREPDVLAFLPEEDRFERLHREADALLSDFPDIVDRPLLFGLTAGVKDIFHVEGFITRAGSQLPSDELQGEEAESVMKLREAGALIAGKTVTTEFAYFSPGPTRNPHHPEHTPGGSSSGSAAAVAADLCFVALGTQTIGSIIRPASFCGVVGVKPTYDRISRKGVIPLSPSLDHVGFFTSSVESAIRVARPLYKDWDEPTIPLRKPILGIPEGPYLEKVSEEGRVHFDHICQRLGTGYTIQRIPIMPDFQSIRDRHDVIMSVEAARVHKDWYGKHEELYSTKFSELIRRGMAYSDSQYKETLKARDDFRAEMRRAMIDHNIDLWICPSSIGAAPKGLESTGDPVMNLPWTQAGLPAMNLPAGENQENLPLGLQLVGNWHKDESMLFWAKDLEKVLSDL
jgi:Asp-tRNA(Asn)/Glu-tRNA(Gln) amidotransferase A subunit family amidase